MYTRAAAALLVLCALGHADAQVCGDVDASGKVTASDALRLLKRSVGQPVVLTCTTGDCIALEDRVAALERRKSLVVFDADGTRLGDLVSIDYNLFGAVTWQIFVPEHGKLMELVVSPDECDLCDSFALFRCDELFTRLYFTTTDCTGTPYLETAPAAPWGPSHMRALGGCGYGDEYFYYDNFYNNFDRLVVPDTQAPNGIALRSFNDSFACNSVTRQTTGGRFYTIRELAFVPFGLQIPLPLDVDAR